MIHYQTRNISFIKMHYLLKELGIKNNTFFLRLYDASLAEIDPHDEENLTLEQQMRIIVEIKRNPWYFFREILKVAGSGGENRFELHRGNLALYTCLLLNLNVVMLTPRQCYKTTSIMAFYLWGLKFGFTNVKIGMFALSEALSQNNMKRLKELMEFLPSYLKVKNKKDIDNVHTLTIATEGNSSTIMTKPVGITEDMAANSARGFSFPILYYDEFAFIEQIEAHYNTAVFSYATAADNAEKNNSYHHIVMTTTAGNLYSKCGVWAWNLLQSAAQFHETIYDMTIIDEDGQVQFDKNKIASYILNQSANSKSIATSFVKIEYEYFELGKGDDYLDNQREFCKSSKPGTFEREVLLKWMMSGSDHPLGHERVEKLREQIRKPTRIELIDNIYFLNIYRDEIDKDIPYVIGVDCSGNMNRDFSTFVAVDPTNFEVVATMRINQHSINRFSKAIVYLMNAVFPRGVVIIERNGVGLGVVDFVRSKLPTNRVWRDEKDIFGINSTKELRELLYSDVLKQSVLAYSNKIHDKTIIDEIFTLEYNKQGKVDHPAGGHDDTLMAYLWCMWFLSYCKTKGMYIDNIYIGLNLNNEEYNNHLKRTEIEEMINMRDMDLLESVRKIRNNGVNEQIVKFDGIKSPEDLVRNQSVNVKKSLDFNRDLNSIKNMSKREMFDYLARNQEELSKQCIQNIKSREVNEEEMGTTVDNIKEFDTEDIENKMTLDEANKLKEEFYRKMSFRKLNNPFQQNNHILNRFNR